MLQYFDVKPLLRFEFFLTHRITLDGFSLHVCVPYFDTEIISADHVSTRIAQFNITYTRYYFREEASICRILRFLEYFTMLVAQCRLSHIAQSYRTLATAVDESLTMVGMELGSCYHFRQFLHISWLNVYYICFFLRIGKLRFFNSSGVKSFLEFENSIGENSSKEKRKRFKGDTREHSA